jgi:hypothetical protein
LALDAYTAGGSFNIQESLYQDSLSHHGRYRWGTARSAEDMRRYFVYNQQFLLHSQQYRKGDIAFFDWDGDDIADHVLIISEVDSNGRPLKMVDASGSFSGNPSGRAFEHSWSGYYEEHVLGHGRISESAARYDSTSVTEVTQFLQVSVDSPAVVLRVLDANGKFVLGQFDENLIASNVEASIPYIPGASQASLLTGHFITISQPLANSAQYLVEVRGLVPTDYNLRVEALQGSSVISSQQFMGHVEMDGTGTYSLTLAEVSGSLLMTVTSRGAAPTLELPGSITLTTVAGISAQGIFTISEVSGNTAFSDVIIDPSDLHNQMGDKLPAEAMSLSTSNFSVQGGANQVVNVVVDTSNIPPGLYLGHLRISSSNAGVRIVPFGVHIGPHSLYMPVVVR